LSVESVDYLVSQEFRKILLDRFPALRTNSAFRYLLGHILYGTWIDSDSGELIIHSKLLAEMNDDVKGWEGGNFEALKFIESFSQDVFYIEYRAQDIYTDPPTARRIVWTSLPDDLKAESLKQTGLGADAVWLASGKPLSGNDGTRIRSTLESEANSLSSKVKSVEALAILTYLNGLPSNRFKKIVGENFQGALDCLNRIDGNRDRQQQWKLLKSIGEQPKPLYKPVANSVRLYGLNPSLLRLRRDVRVALTSGWHSADLHAAQLAIIAKIWNCPLTMEFLSEGKSIWSSLARHFNEPSEDFKPAYKELLYRIAFGAGDTSLRKFAAKSLGCDESFDRFLAHPIISEVWKAREQTKRRLNDEKHLVDAFGNVLRLDQNAKLVWTPETSKYRTTSNALSLMAQQAQSYEMKLMWPIFEKAMSIGRDDRHGFMITSYLFDGFTFVPFDSRDIEKWISWLQGTVSRQASELGIPTRLEVEKIS
jgi:hypothetical protein